MKFSTHCSNLRDAVDSFINPLDEGLLQLQELAAVLSCSDRRFLPAKYLSAQRSESSLQLNLLKRTQSSP